VLNVKVVLQYFHWHCYKSSLLWFIVGWTKTLVRMSWMNTRVYMDRAARA
jgi:hypothetical protein